MEKKMWVVLFHLTRNMWGSTQKPWDFEEDVWGEFLQAAADKGFNTILLDLGDGVCYKSHPEISLEGAWSHEKVKAEIKKANDLGLTVIPKLNFSTLHDCWLGIYERMVSTEPYYTVCRDLIQEVYELFNHPDYIHLGMDEEGYRMGGYLDFVSYRQHDLLWHDMKFLFKCVTDLGAKPWIWADFLLEDPENFKKHIKPEDVLLSPWQYWGMYEEHFTPITVNQEQYEYYTTGFFKNSGFTYVEEDPLCDHYRERIIPDMEEGYQVVPTTSNVFDHEYNHDDTLRWFKEYAPDDKVVGFMTASWLFVNKNDKEKIHDDMDRLMKAKKVYYPD